MSARVTGDKAAPALPARLPWALLTVTVVLVVVMDNPPTRFPWTAS